MSRIMRDSINPAEIPLAGLELVAGYINGHYAWTSPGWDRFPGLPWVTIDALATHPSADVLDVEPGNPAHDAASAKPWVTAAAAIAHRAYPPILYCDRDLYPQLLGEFGNSCRYWVTTLDGTKFTGEHVMGCQDKGQAQSGGHYDESVIYDDSFCPVASGIVVQGTLGGLRSRNVISRDRGHAIWTPA